MRGSRPRFWKSSALATLLLVGGCTSMLGIDGDYVAGVTAKGSGGSHGTETDGSLGANGGQTGIATGGEGGAGGQSDGTGGGSPFQTCSPDAAACPAGQKCCGGGCADPQPLIGCSLDGCTACPVPSLDGVAKCVGGACTVVCNSGFVQSGTECVAAASGGATGAGGRTATGGRTTTATGGKPASTCVAKNCPGCVPVGPFGCCKNDGTCGCTWAPGAICY